MGLFDIFASREERTRGQLRRLARKVTEKYGPPENRQKVIQQLGEMGTPAALKTLCLRFTVRADVGIQDDEEKEMARRILVEAGSTALEPVKEFLAEQESGIAWGLRVLSALVPPGEVVEAALRLLHKLGREYTRDPEKKLVLLSWLMEHPATAAAVSAPPTPPSAPTSTPTATSPSAPTAAPAAPAQPGPAAPAPTVAEAILPLLEDFSDDVRIGATRVLARQPPSEPARRALIELLLRDRDNARVRGEVLEALAQLGADVKGFRPSVEPLLVEPFFLDKEGRVKKRGPG